MSLTMSPPAEPRASFQSRAERITGAVAAAAILLFVGTGVRAVSAFQIWSADEIALPALLLNIALILFAWRRHKEAGLQSRRRREAEEEARLLSTRDPLTNLLARAAMHEAGRDMAKAACAAGEGMALVVLGLDRFRHVNEVYGHVAGDALLRDVSAAIAETARPGALCARIGADEFCIAGRFQADAAREALQLAERLVQRIGGTFQFDEVAIRVGVSAGIAHVEADCAEFEALLHRASIAMAAAKKAGGNRTTRFEPAMEQALKARNGIEAGLRRGIPAGEFVPFFQPQVELATGRISGLEVLARWNRPDGEAVGPDTFIPIAEETGLIGDLFESICRQSLTQALNWDAGLTLAINISPSQLKDPWLAHKILKILVETGFPAERLEIEITESSLLENLALAQATVASLKNQGVQLALDDFGTGYSSLANLRALPFDRIKIDRSFVDAMAQDPESRAIVTAIARMGESLGVPVTAEGVTGDDLREMLLQMGCDTGQGWLFGKPLSAPEATLLLAMQGLVRIAPEPAAIDREPLPEQRRRASLG